MSPYIWFLVAAMGFAGGWEVQSWRYGAKENARAQQELVDQRSAATTAIRRQETVIDATVAANGRELVLRRDADSARGSLDGLRGSTARALQRAGTSLAACLERANALGDVLNTVAGAGGQLAEKAGRHANDAQTCHDGWPK